HESPLRHFSPCFVDKSQQFVWMFQSCKDGRNFVISEIAPFVQTQHPFDPLDREKRNFSLRFSEQCAILSFNPLLSKLSSDCDGALASVFAAVAIHSCFAEFLVCNHSSATLRLHRDPKVLLS